MKSPNEELTEEKRAEIEKHENSLIVGYQKVQIAHGTHILSWHPLITHKISMMRDLNVNCTEFGCLVEEVATLICCEAMQKLEMEDYIVETPICTTVGRRIAGKKLVIVPILRAGLGMAGAVKRVVPKSRVAHLGMYRNEETKEPVWYFKKHPSDMEERAAFILDPMLATGGSADAAIQYMKDIGCKSITVMCIIAAPQGVDRIQKNHPDVEIYAGCLDKGLNEDGYIVPGLGDAGDRLFGTK
ncbi:MAG: uracil phosphoribosyltransferase [Candidatus Saccharibacteria bacterium]|nr:uracil phosphoribosyltransferase [Candidatus Saccharibacteria bacterium]